MLVFVVLSLVLVVIALSVVGAAAISLRGGVRSLRAAVGAANDRLGPLAQELREESAVTALELEAVARTRSSKRRPPG